MLWRLFLGEANLPPAVLPAAGDWHCLAPVGAGSDGEWESDGGNDGSEGTGSEDDGESVAEGEDMPESTSRVVSVTADFSMQNVILQMGLRLAAPDGLRITRLSRWVLRCSACTHVSKVRRS